MRREEDYDMSIMKSQLFLAMIYTLLFLAMIGLSGCGGGGGGGNSVNKVLASIAIKPVDNKLAVGKSQQFTATSTYADGTTSSDSGLPVIWSSSSTSVATITSKGMATAVAVGKTTITATLGEISGTTTLEVPLPPPITLNSIKITPATPTIAINTAQQFTATGAYSDGTTKVLTSGVTWNSSDTSKATITTDGKANAVAAGTTVIKATSGSISGTTNLSVSSATITSITLIPSNPTIAKGTTKKFDVTGTLSDGTTQDLSSSVTWSSSSSTVATITPDGIASAIAAGSTSITAAIGSISATTTLNVSSATLVSITVVSIPDIASGTIQLSAIGTFSDNTTQDLTSQVTWSLPSGTIASITQDGKLTAVASGTIPINATLGGVTGSQSVNVSPVVVTATGTGTWEGTYSIYDSIDPTQIGTYTFKLVLTQSGTSVTGTSSLRYATNGQLQADGLFLRGDMTGSRMDFTYSYNDPKFSREMVNMGTATISDTSMTGDVIENYNGGYNCSYTFSLKKL